MEHGIIQLANHPNILHSAKRAVQCTIVGRASATRVASVNTIVEESPTAGIGGGPAGLRSARKGRVVALTTLFGAKSKMHHA